MYWTMAIKSFAISLIGVFVPAFLYNLGFSLQEIILYFLIRELAELVMVLPTTVSMQRGGIRRTFAVGCLMTIVNLFLLFLLPDYRNLLFLTAIIEGIAISLFFLPYHYMFSEAVTKKGGGQQLGFMDIIVSIVAALGPLIGGVVADATNLQFVLLMAVSFTVLSLTPLIRKSRPHLVNKISYSMPFRLLFSRDSVSNMGFGITEMVATIIWPLFIFLIVKNYATLGFVVSGSLLVIILLDLTIGKMTDNGHSRWLLRTGSLSSALIHICRILATSTPIVAAMNILSDVSHALFRLPWTREFYKHAGADRASYIASMELAVCLGRSFLWVLLLLAAPLTSESDFMLLAFMLGALGSLLVPSILPNRRPRRL